MANRIVLTGRLTADPELRQTPGEGVPVTSFTIAVPKKYKKEGADFIDVVAWRQRAEFICQYFTKGKWIEIDGSLQTRSYEDKESKKRKAVEVLADEVSFVGDKPKDEASPASTSPPPPSGTPVNFDPFAAATSPDEFDDDGDLPF